MLVVLVHGGAWVGGNEKSLVSVQDTLEEYGHTAVRVTYRRSTLDPLLIQRLISIETPILLAAAALTTRPSLRLLFLGLFVFITVLACLILVFHDGEKGNVHPNHVLDIVAAIDSKLKSLGKREFVLLGHSAGAHLASLVATDGQYMRQVGRDIADIQGFIGLSGLYCHTTMTASITNIMSSSIFAAGVTQAPLGAFAVTHVTDQSPPMLICCTTSDFSLITHARRLFEACVEHGVPVEYRCYANHTHFTIKDDWDNCFHEAREDVLDFLDQLRDGSEEPRPSDYGGK